MLKALLEQLNFKRKNLRVWVLLLFVLAQAGALFHLSEHAIAGDNEHCAVCVVAAQTGNGVLPETLQLVTPERISEQAAQLQAHHFHASFESIYVARAPPSRA